MLPDAASVRGLPSLLSSFNPLNLARELDPSQFRELRAAEVKHARLGMLAAVGWPLQEVLHPLLAEVTHSRNVLAPGGLSPSLLNGGLTQAEVLPALSVAVFLGAMLELNEARTRRDFGLSVRGCACTGLNVHTKLVGTCGRRLSAC